MKKGLTYGDVLIQPQYSEIKSRSGIDVTTNYLGRWRYPIISAPMDSVTGPEMAIAMAQSGAYGILSRFPPNDITPINHIFESNPYIRYGVSIGVKDIENTLKWLDSIKFAKIHSICIDVAHGYHSLVWETVERLRYWRLQNKQYPYLIAGNVATAEGFQYLMDTGVDAIRVGIGPGAACTTRETTGVGIPQLTAILDCAKVKGDVALIADGGIQEYGDIAKAIAAGADAVMLGRMLAGADESAAPDNQGGKLYRGQSSIGINAERGAPEGVEGWIPKTGPVKDTLNTINNYLRSSYSYVGANTTDEFREKAKFIKVSPATLQESYTRLGSL